MSEVFSAKEYKMSKVVVNDLTTILKVVDLTMRELNPFKIYKPVQRILLLLNEEKSILESHLEKYKQIRREKGRLQ